MGNKIDKIATKLHFKNWQVLGKCIVSNFLDTYLFSYFYCDFLLLPFNFSPVAIKVLVTAGR